MRHRKMIMAMGLAACVAMALMAVPAGAATEAQKDTAIAAGLAHLASTQQADGRWNYGDDNYDCAATAAALLAFAEEGHTTTSGTAYSSVVQNGINFLMSRGTFSGGGIKFVPGGNNTRDTYVTGLVVPAIVANNTPTANGSGALAALTHSQIVQQAINYFDGGQNPDGGWRYYANYGNSDNSTTQWPVLSMLYAQQWGISPPNPATVQTGLDGWISSIQNGDGGSLYDLLGSISGSNMSRTGGLLLEMAYNGWDTGTAAEQAAYQAALNYVNANWPTTANSTWNGNFGHPYAMWGVYKGLETTIGLADTTAITNLHAAGPIDPGDTWNWWEDYCEHLVNTQQASGAWSGYSYWGDPLSTAWAINILNATQVGGPVVPEPLTCGALLLGLGGMWGYVRKRRRAQA